MNLEQRKSKLKAKFHDLFLQENTDYFSSSGRIELLGNHTDHNRGSVIVGAVDLDILAATRKREDRKVVIYSKGYPKISLQIDDRNLREEESGKSIAIVRGVLHRLFELGYCIGGFSCYLESSVYAGAGVSSSAAYECLIVAILNDYYNENRISPLQMAEIAQYSESVYFMKPCGLLDQCGVAFGGVNRIDFKDISCPVVENIQADFSPYCLVLVNTGGSHSHLTEQYKAITEEMKAVANFFGKEYLREVPEPVFIQKLKELRERVSDRAVQRAMHFFEENKIVEKGFAFLKEKQIEKFLECVDRSGRNSYELLQNNINVSSERQNISLAIGLTRELLSRGAVRVHGGGFEGTILAFVHREDLKDYLQVMRNVFGRNNVHDVEIRNCGAKKV